MTTTQAVPVQLQTKDISLRELNSLGAASTSLNLHSTSVWSYRLTRTLRRETTALVRPSSSHLGNRPVRTSSSQVTEVASKLDRDTHSTSQGECQRLYRRQRALFGANWRQLTTIGSLLTSVDNNWSLLVSVGAGKKMLIANNVLSIKLYMN